ncbi:exosortase/archaeosortase family protein [Novipirellula maiorica]|uniref:exosortase/archaeosortase family protein n=1 Tax=Novipirellula maiorica TaxID=1265734 RepID=UPI001181A14B|nr:exosortase/archaeosortase family protein [Rhodopirellula maiorica]
MVRPGQAWWVGFGLPAAVAVLAALVYAYWPTLVWIEETWRNEPDYSHGYLVLPLALLLCWNRLDQITGIRQGISWAGLSLIALAVVMRLAGRLVYADFLDAWSMLPLIAGVVWVCFGFSVLRWALPAIAFLFLMFPLPYQAESLLSWKLQGVATDLSTIMLRVFGQPAVSEGHVIWINDLRLQVEEACSGLRIFIGVAALAFFWAAMVRRSWLDRVVLLAMAVPLAVMVNSVRITVVGLLYQVFDDSVSQGRIHDISGYLMIPFAFGLLWLVKVYWERLYRPLEQMTARDFVQGIGGA